MSDKTILFLYQIIVACDESRLYSLTNDIMYKIGAWVFAIAAVFSFIIYIAPAIRKFINGK